MPNYAGYEWAQGRAVHRWVWEQAHGPIPKGGIIHHIDGDRTNNAIENLMLVRSPRDHLRVHRGWELREDGWWRPRHKREDGPPMVRHIESATPRRHAVVPVVSRTNLALVINEAKEPYRTMLQLQWAVGMRPGEVCKMRLVDLCMEDGEIITPRDGKTGERRLYFDTSGTAAEALRAWLAMRPQGPYLFGGAKPVRVNTYYVTVMRYCDRLGIPRFRPYALRHTYATELLHERQALPDISAALGHASVMTTAQHYAHVDPDMMRRLNAGR